MQYFSDVLTELTVSNGVVHIGFGVQHKSKNDAKLEALPSAVINMPVESFANSLPILQGLLDKLLKDGVLKVNDKKQLSS